MNCKLDSSNAISMIRGTSVSFSVAIVDADGNPYVLPEGAVVRFGVKQDPALRTYLIKKEAFEGTDGVFNFNLVPEDTDNLAFGTYAYDIGVQVGIDYHNVIPASPFSVCENITQKE